jgi:methyltransferase (TIGR00027 family)
MNQPSPGISRTSLYVAAGRAVGAREPDPAARNPDYLAEKLLGDPSTMDLDHPIVRALSLSYDEAMKSVAVVNAVRMPTIRTRFIDDALERAVTDGATQVVILGAGLDSHAYRCRELLARVGIFEVDRPAMQEMKKRRVRAVIGSPPANLTYVPADLQREDLPDVLARHGCDPRQQTFFIFEGVTMYLPEEAVKRVFRLAAASAPGSAIVFDFVSRAMIESIARIDITKVPEDAKAFVEQFLSVTRHEPWIFGLPLDGERDYLRDVGLELREELSLFSEEAATRYLTRADGSQVGAETLAAAMARVVESARAAGAPQVSPEQMRAQQKIMSHLVVEAAVPPRA